MIEDEKPNLKQANKNPWYILATLYGEQPEQDRNSWFDEKLAAKNRIAWNRWLAAALSREQRERLISKGFNGPELEPLSDDEKSNFLSAYAARAGGKGLEPPAPNGTCNFSGIHFECPVCFVDYVFVQGCDFSWDTFLDKARFNGAIFFGFANFRGTRLPAYLDFSGALFLGGANFADATFSGTTYFSHAQFHNFLNFRASEFKYIAYFNHAQFRWDAPDFRDATPPEGLEWPDEKGWPPPPKTEVVAHQHIRAYAWLKAEMEKRKRHEDEQFFFANELRARRALEKRFSPQWLANFL